MDLIPEEQRDPVFAQRERELKRLAHPLGLVVTCFKTSIWDETLYRAWSLMVYSLIPNRDSLEAQLDKLCRVCHADEVVLFERATFLVISNAVCKAHSDVHRFEKVSNIIKQFKLSCSKTQAHFSTMQVRNAHYSAFIEGFTSTTYVMVIVSNRTMYAATTLINIEASRSHFESLINSCTAPQ
jgi:Ras-related GTP-binding protein A/B